VATVFARGSRAVVARNTADDTPSDTAFDQRDGWRTRAPLGLLSPLPAVRCRQAGLIEMKRAAVRAVISSAMMALTVTTAAEPHVLSANHPRGCRELVAGQTRQRLTRTLTIIWLPIGRGVIGADSESLSLRSKRDRRGCASYSCRRWVRRRSTPRHRQGHLPRRQLAKAQGTRLTRSLPWKPHLRSFCLLRRPANMNATKNDDRGEGL
jgi:hypothetical protein